MVQIQAIELVNDGSGLGFGIIGSRPSGVIVKTILHGGVADRDQRLKSGDHILQIGDVNLHEMGSDQVASVLRQSGTHVRLVVARPVDPMFTGIQYDIEPGTVIVPSRYLINPTELQQYLIECGNPDIFGENSCASTPQTTTEEEERFVYRSEYITPMTSTAEIPLPETENVEVELTKDQNGLGITIAGYVCEKEELSGIFVKSVSNGSAADLSGKIHVNDRIIEVDGQSLQGFSNHQAVELLKKSGKIVNLKLERYLRGPKYEQLQQAIAANDKVPSSIPSTPSRSLALHYPSQIPQHASSDDFSTSEIQSDVFSPDLISEHSNVKLVNSIGKKTEQPSKIPKKKIIMDAIVAPVTTINENSEKIEISKSKYFVDPMTIEIESSIIRKWRSIIGSEVEIIVAQFQKLTATSGLGISLEGTVDVEGKIFNKIIKNFQVFIFLIKRYISFSGGIEVRPHHYIRNILPEGPVGQNGKLKSGDELLEVNGQRLLGMNHLEVVAILKELPQDIRIVCSRGQQPVFQSSIVMGPLGGSMKKLNSNSNLDNVLPISSDRLVKAKSDGSLATTSSSVIGFSSVLGGCDPDDSFSNKLKSRSLEPLTGLAMWSSEPQIIELIKGDRGLGFSILDYQDPIDPNDTLIVIRSLVPGGVAQNDGRLIPGDRLLFVNNINLENASLDHAVQALKGAPKGIVKIGVAKPLPLQDNLIKTEQLSDNSGISNASTAEPFDGKSNIN